MRKIFRRYMPDPVTLQQSRLFSVLGSTLLRPEMWHLNRRAAARGVAIGLFCGLIPGPLQMLAAALVCIVARANLPIALATTFYTNPLTIVPLYAAAFSVGSWLMGANASFVLPPEKGAQSLIDWSIALFHWLSGLGQPLALGLLTLATSFAVLGYFAVSIVWRRHIQAEIRRRARTNK